MKPAAFDYRVPEDTADAMRSLDQLPGTAKVVAGSQSLGPLLNLRLTRPATLVDVAMLPALRETHETDDGVLFGAAVTHAEIEDGEVPDPTPGWLQAAAANIAHRAVRNRGTLGGSLAHADPTADWPVVMLGLGATLIAEGLDGQRKIAIEDFLTGPFETSLGEAEILVAVHVPRPDETARWAYWKFTRQVGEFAKASAVVLTRSTDGEPRIALGALPSQPKLIETSTARGLLSGEIDALDAVADLLPQSTPRERGLHVTVLRNALREASAIAPGSGAAP